MRRSLAALVALAPMSCRQIYVPETEESSEPPIVEPPGPCSELVWDRDEPLPLDPLYGVNGSLHRLVVAGADVMLVSTALRPELPKEILTTRIQDPWGEELAVSPAVERGSITGSPMVAVGPDGAVTVYARRATLEGADHERVTLPGGDGPAPTPELLEQVAAVVWDEHGWQGLVVRETLEVDQEGQPTSQRVALVDAWSMVEVGSYQGGPLQFFEAVPSFAGGALVSFYDDWNDGEPTSHEQWLVRPDAISSFPFDGHRWFGRSASSDAMIVDAEDELLSLAQDGSIESSFGALSADLKDTPGSLAIVPWEQGHALVTVKHEHGAADGALRVRAYPEPDRELVSEPLPANELEVGDPFAVLPGPDGRSLLVAYEQTPAFTGARIARLTCR